MIRLVVLAMVAAAPLAAASADDLLAQIAETLPAEARTAQPTAARAEAISALLSEDLGLAPVELLKMRLSLAEAWIDAGELNRSRAEAVAVAADPGCPPALRERAGLAVVAAQRAQRRSSTAAVGAIPPQEPALAAFAAFPRVIAAALVGDAEDLLRGIDDTVFAARQAGEDAPAIPADIRDRILAWIDRAITLLKESPPDERTPIYALRVDAMERMQVEAETIQEWLQEHQADPAVALILESALSQGQRLIGAAAPALTGPRADGVVGTVNLADLAGKPVLVIFMATWSAPSDAAMTAAVRTLADHPDIAVIGVSLDRPETIPRLPGYLQRFGATFPVIGDGLGWDSERDDAWGIEAIPAMILVGADGKVRARDLIGRDAEGSRRAIDKALAPMTKELPAPGGFVP